MEGYYNPDYKIKRNNLLAYIVTNAASLILHFNYDISYEHRKRLRDLGDKGFVLLPKHQHWLDIPLDGLLLKETLNRYGNYIMKNVLPKWILEPLGGISIIRGRDDLPELVKKHGKKKAIEIAKEKENEIYSYAIPNLLARNEIIVTYIEGHRYFQKEAKITASNVKNLMKSQKMLGEQITFVPVDSEYKDKEVIIKVGKPIKVPDNGLEELIEHLRNEVELWC